MKYEAEWRGFWERVSKEPPYYSTAPGNFVLQPPQCCDVCYLERNVYTTSDFTYFYTQHWPKGKVLHACRKHAVELGILW